MNISQNWGGRRKPKPTSSNTAWRNASFRGYAAYIETEEFKKGIERLIDLTSEVGPTAIMCAEAVWWRCHRALISHYLQEGCHELIPSIVSNKTSPPPCTST